jgi:hypothetical protein
MTLVMVRAARSQEVIVERAPSDFVVMHNTDAAPRR